MHRDKNKPGFSGAGRLVETAMLFAMTVILAAVENQLPLPSPAPGVKLGLSNIVVMYALFFSDRGQALLLAVLKALFVFLTRGAAAAFLSLCGGLFSIGAMILLLFLFRDRISVLMVSVAGAVFHNIGQLIAVSVLYANLFFLAYFPVLLLSGIVAGTATSALLKVTLPALKKLHLYRKNGN